MIFIDWWIQNKVDKEIEEKLKIKGESIFGYHNDIKRLQVDIDKLKKEVKENNNYVDKKSRKFDTDLEKANDKLYDIIKSEMLRIDSYSEALEVATNKKYGVCKKRED